MPILVLLLSFNTLSAQSNTCRNLLQAVKDNNYDLVETILNDAHPNCSYRGDGEPRSPLGAAAVIRNVSMERLLFNAGAKVTYRYENDASALMLAAQNQQYDFVVFLLKKGAKANEEVDGDGTPLMAAIEGGDYRIVKLLLQKGAKPNLSVAGDETPLIGAAWNGHLDVVKYLVSSGAESIKQLGMVII